MLACKRIAEAFSKPQTTRIAKPRLEAPIPLPVASNMPVCMWGGFRFRGFSLGFLVEGLDSVISGSQPIAMLGLSRSSRTWPILPGHLQRLVNWMRNSSKLCPGQQWGVWTTSMRRTWAT